MLYSERLSRNDPSARPYRAQRIRFYVGRAHGRVSDNTELSGFRPSSRAVERRRLRGELPRRAKAQERSRPKAALSRAIRGPASRLRSQTRLAWVRPRGQKRRFLRLANHGHPVLVAHWMSSERCGLPPRWADSPRSGRVARAGPGREALRQASRCSPPGTGG
jgi:hypothetical protein